MEASEAMNQRWEQKLGIQTALLRMSCGEMWARIQAETKEGTNPGGIQADLVVSVLPDQILIGKSQGLWLSHPGSPGWQGIAAAYLDPDGQAYNLGTLPRDGGFRQIIDRKVGVSNEGRPLVQWLSDPSALLPNGDAAGPGIRETAAEREATGTPVHRLVKDLLFHGAGDHQEGNSGLRFLDQSWRLRPVVGAPGQSSAYREEAILVARTAPVRAQAEKLTQEGGAPTRLWLGSLPGKGAERPELRGVLTQDTYVRVYVPVK